MAFPMMPLLPRDEARRAARVRMQRWLALLAPFTVHGVAASLLLARVLPAMERRLDAIEPVRAGLGPLVLLLGVLPAAAPLAVALLTVQATEQRAAVRWYLAGLWLLAADTVWRAVAAWHLPPPLILGDVLERVVVPVDVLGRLVQQALPTAPSLGVAGAVGLTQALAILAFGVAVSVARSEAVPSPARRQPAVIGRGVLGGAVAAVLAVAVVQRSAPLALGVWFAAVG